MYIREWASVYKGMGRRDAGVGCGVEKAKTKKQDDTVVKFRVVMTSTCTHKGPIFHYKAYTDVCGQWEQYQVPTAKFEPSIGTISPVVDLHGQKKALWRSRPVDISQWRQ